MLVGQEHHLPGNTQDKVSPWADLTKFVNREMYQSAAGVLLLQFSVFS